jgi:DNA-directed RNA polymerase subunit beta
LSLIITQVQRFIFDLMSNNNIPQRISFASTKNQLQYPDFLEVQLKSFRDFFQLDTTPERRKEEGLYKVFSENFPISDTRNNFGLELIRPGIQLMNVSKGV